MPNIYVANDDRTEGPRISITDAGDRGGSRMVFESTAGFCKAVGAGSIVSATGEWGVYTAGQFNCMAVTVIYWPGGGTWGRANLAHVSSAHASRLNAGTDLYAGLGGPGSLYAVIGARDSVRQGALAVAQKVAENGQVPPGNIWIYLTSDTSNALAFGVNRFGFFAEVAVWKSGR